jgi:hypothetical protein
MDPLLEEIYWKTGKAGSPAPQVAATAPAGGPESLNYAHLAAGVAVLLPLIEASGAGRRQETPGRRQCRNRCRSAHSKAGSRWRLAEPVASAGRA